MLAEEERPFAPGQVEPASDGVQVGDLDHESELLPLLLDDLRGSSPGELQSG